MGLRYIKVLKSLNFIIIGVCDKNIKKLNNINISSAIKTTNINDLLKIKADIVCISSNTFSREKIIEKFLNQSQVKRLLIEKPLATSYKKCLTLEKLIKKRKKMVVVNTFRKLSLNFKKVMKLFNNKKENITHISILSPSAGLGNMGSIFFDICNFYLKEKPLSVNCEIDTTGTINSRGKQFKDPGGYGVIRYAKQKKVFFDLSENTGLPYKIILKSENLEVTIDEINKNFIVSERPKKLKKKPINYYLFQPKISKMQFMDKYDVVEMTKLSVKKLFKKKFVSNLRDSLNAMQLVFACHASRNIKNTIKLPLKGKYHNMKVNFP